jgi:tetratricopeptide (TPR) repeat protein
LPDLPHSGAARFQLCVLIALLALVTSGCGGARARYASHFARGQQYLQQGNLEKAGIEFRNALQIQPKDPDALYFAGQVAEQRRDPREAVGLFQAAIDIRPDFPEARAHLGRMLVFGGASKRALDVVAPALLQHPDNPDLLAVRAAARKQLKDPQAALADAEHATQVAPGNENAVAVLAALYADQRDYGHAIDVVTAAIVRRPDSVDLREVLTNLYLLSSQPEKAEEQMRRVIELKPAELAPRAQLAAYLRRARKLDSAQSVLEESVRTFTTLKQQSKLDQARLLLVDFVATERSREQGEKLLRESIAREPDNYELRFGLAALLQRAGAITEASLVYQDIIKRNKLGARGLAARDRMAALEIGQNHPEQAGQWIAQVLKENPRDNDALIMRAELALRRQDATNAISDLRAVLRNQPRSVVLQRSLAKAYLQKGQPALAEEALRAALDVGPDDAGTRTELAQLLLQGGRAEQAVTVLQEGLHRTPQSQPLRVALIGTYLQKPDYRAARSAAEELKVAQPQSPLGYYFVGVVAQREGRLEESERELGRALALKPGDLDTLRTLARVDTAAGKPERSIARVQAAADAAPNDARVANLLGELLLRSKDFERAVAQFARGTELEPHWWVPYRNLAIAHAATRDEAAAILDYEEGLKVAPLEPALVLDAAQFFEQHGRIEAAIAAYQRLYKGNRAAADLAANNLAMLLATYRTDQESLDQARDLTNAFASSDNSALLDTGGWVRFKRGEFRDALPFLERASAKSPDSKLIWYHLAMAELRLGMKDRARAHLESALEGAGTFSGSEDARTALATLTARSG